MQDSQPEAQDPPQLVAAQCCELADHLFNADQLASMKLARSHAVTAQWHKRRHRRRDLKDRGAGHRLHTRDCDCVVGWLSSRHPTPICPRL